MFKDLLSSSGQVRSRSGMVQVWCSLQLKFNSLELEKFPISNIVNLRSRSKVRSGSGPRSGPGHVPAQVKKGEGLRAKDRARGVTLKVE